MSDDKYKDKDNFSSNSSWGFFHIEIPSGSGWDGRLENQVQQDDDGTQRAEGSVQGVGKQGDGNKYKYKHNYNERNKYTSTTLMDGVMTQVEDAKEKNAGLAAQKEDLTGKQIRLNAKLDELTTENRFLSLGSNLKYLLLLVGTWRAPC